MLEALDAQAMVVPMRTRLPFRYGIAELTVAPHVVIEITVSWQGQEVVGRAADHLPPKWFTKDATTSFAEDLPALVAVVEHATGLARQAGPHANPFAWWDAIDDLQQAWAGREDVPPLLAGLGTSLVERAVLDAVCRAEQRPFLDLLRAGALGFSPDRLHPALADVDWTRLVGNRIADTVSVRHTVGLADPLTPDEVGDDDPADGLPVSLREVVERYGVDHIKIKLSGDEQTDHDRLRTLCTVVGDAITTATMDGNEQFTSVEHLRDHLTALRRNERIRRFLTDTVTVLEQPFHRDVALEVDLRGEQDLPPTIIDESDAERSSARHAVEELGYAGTSFKSCKGVFRGLANAAWLGWRRTQGAAGVVTAEDLSNVGPIALLQDLVGVAAIGVDHVERNGHHYFGRPAPLGADTDAHLLRHHPDLYVDHGNGRASLRIDRGELSLRTVTRAPYGYGGDLDTTATTSLSLNAALEAIGEPPPPPTTGGNTTG